MVNGGYAYGYLFMSQNPFVEEMFTKLLTDIKPARILEIGTFHGGLTLLLRDILDEIHLVNNPIRTYDIHEQEFLKPLVIDRQVEVYTKNLFNESYDSWSSNESKNEILEYITQDGTSLVLCDGGCKKCEFNLITPLLKNNDIIMAHDYAPNEKYFNKYMHNKIWDWLEIQDNDIESISNQYCLQPYCQEIAQKAAWCCRIRSGLTIRSIY